MSNSASSTPLWTANMQKLKRIEKRTIRIIGAKSLLSDAADTPQQSSNCLAIKPLFALVVFTLS